MGAPETPDFCGPAPRLSLWGRVGGAVQSQTGL